MLPPLLYETGIVQVINWPPPGESATNLSNITVQTNPRWPFCKTSELDVTLHPPLSEKSDSQLDLVLTTKLITTIYHHLEFRGIKHRSKTRLHSAQVRLPPPPLGPHRPWPVVRAFSGPRDEHSGDLSATSGNGRSCTASILATQGASARQPLAVGERSWRAEVRGIPNSMLS